MSKDLEITDTICKVLTVAEELIETFSKEQALQIIKLLKKLLCKNGG